MRDLTHFPSLNRHVASCTWPCNVPFFLLVLSIFNRQTFIFLTSSTPARRLIRPTAIAHLAYRCTKYTHSLAMAMELTWSLDYCLACDKQTQGETYCSQSCRLADLETSSLWSGPMSPTTCTSSTSTNRGSGFYLAPAINFDAYKSSTPSPKSSNSFLPLTSYFSSEASTQVAVPKRLSPSSSQSSLSSTRSTSSQSSPLSEQARSELLGYTNSFDNIRNWKRRMTWS